MAEPSPAEFRDERSNPRAVSNGNLLAWVVFVALGLAAWTTYVYYSQVAMAGPYDRTYFAIAAAVLAGLLLFTLYIALRSPIPTTTSGPVAREETMPQAESSGDGTEEFQISRTTGNTQRPAEMVRNVTRHPTSRGAVVRAEYEVADLKASDYRIESGGRRWDFERLMVPLDRMSIPGTRTSSATNGGEGPDASRGTASSRGASA